jgi:Resolvase, N terminal domain/Recombinase
LRSTRGTPPITNANASIADQLRICREFAARQGWTVVQEFSDHAISGATLLRSEFQALMRDALNRRLRHRPCRIAGPLQPRPGRYRRALQAPHLRRRQHRHARRRRHHASAHRVQRDDECAVPERPGRENPSRTAWARGEWQGWRRALLRLPRGEIAGRWNPHDWRTSNRAREAAIVERIFREYVAGIAPKAIAKRLNQDGIAATSASRGDLSTFSRGCRSAAWAAPVSSWPAATVSHASALARRARAATTSPSDETKLKRGSSSLSSGSYAFQACAIDHSAISPQYIQQLANPRTRAERRL